MLLKSQGLLNAEDTRMLDEIRTVNILGNPEAITAIQEYPVERTTGKKRRKAYINTNPEPTYESTAPNLWYLN